MAKKLREIVVAVTADTGAYQREMNRQARMGGDYFKSVEQGAKRADAAYQRNAASIRMQVTELGGATSAITEYARVVAGAFAGAKLLQYADAWGQISSRLKIATGDQDAFNSAQDRLMVISGRVFKEYGQTAELFIRTNESLAQLGYTSEQTLDLVEAFSYGLTVSSASSEKAAKAVNALSKAIQTGKVSMDQFDSVISAAPRLQQALAESLGVTNAQLRQMVADGRLTTAELMKLSSQIKKMGQEADAMPVTVADAFTRLSNEMQRYVGEANQARGVTEYLTQGINLLSDNIDLVMKAAAVGGVGYFAKWLGEMGGEAWRAVAAVRANRKELIEHARAQMLATQAALARAKAARIAALEGLAAARGTAQETRMAIGAAEARMVETAATNAAAAAQQRYAAVTSVARAAGAGLLGMLGGPAGLIGLAASAAAGWLLFRDSTKSAAAELASMKGPMDEVISKFKGLNLVQQEAAHQEVRKQLDAARRAMEDGFRALENAPLKLRVSPDFDNFRQEVHKLATAELPFDELQTKLVGLVDALAKTVPNSRASRAAMMEFVDATLQARRSVDQLTERSKAFDGAQSEVASGARAMGAAVTSASGGMASADWEKYLKNLTSARDLIGLTAQQAGQYKAKAEGASQAQAMLAGAIAGQAEAAQKLKKATEDKDSKAIAGAKATLSELVRVEAQQRAIIASAQEAVRLQVSLSKGILSPQEFNSMVAAAGRAAREAAVLEGTRRTEAQIATIGKNAVPTKAARAGGDDWKKWVKERQAEAVAQNELAAAYLKGGAAVERATQAKRIEDAVIRQNGRHRAEIVALLNAEAEARSKADASKQIADMGKEIALIDAKTEAERVLWETQNGAYAALDENIKKALVGRAKELDLARKGAARNAYIGQVSGRTEADDTLEKLGWLADAFDRNQLSAEQYRRALGELTGEGLSDLTQFAIQGARNIQSYLGDGLYQAVTGKFEGIGNAFLDMLTRMATQAASAKLGEALFGNFGSTNQIGGLVGALGGAIGGMFGAASSSLPETASWAMPKFAKGGAFTNGVVDSPIAFPMGVMGEAGPEAIMPLHRGADGSLGVRAEFPSMPAPMMGGGMQVTINIDQRGESATESSDGAEEFGRGLAGVVRSYVQQFVPIEINRSFRSGGALWNAQNNRKA
ncbi:tape measure protein [Achromobacter xylosoxidans]